MTMLRTVRRGDVHVTGADYLIVGAITVVAPALIGGVAALLLSWLEGNTGPVGVLAKALAFSAGQMIAPVVTIFAVPLALGVGALALRIGWAGWLLAILVPMIMIAAGMYAYAHSETGYAPWVYVEPARVFMASGALHGLVMWCALRWRRPAALAPRGRLR